ncbi:MAG: trypsin-like peptidase domain-containing protein [Nitrososphaerales archaeon]|nr:trypsin-like peptidase domain-containing protein [Nitrososphaerales archaeon]
MISKSLTIVAVIGIIAIAFSGVNSYLLYNHLQSEQDLQDIIDEMNSKINPVESEQSSLSNQISDILEALSSDNDELREIIESLQTQSPKDVYETVHKSVVVVRTDSGQGSGFLFGASDDNYILTNWHVIEGASEIEVEFYDRTISNAVLIGTDAYSDVAVIMSEKTPIDSKPLRLVNSSNLSIGQQLVAIGNPLGREGSLSSGIVSQINMKLNLEEVPILVPVIQIDLTIAPGNSGGPLLDLNGNVVGITNAGTDYGFNFAIPSNIVSRVSSSIIEKGYYNHALVGITQITLTPENIQTNNMKNIKSSQKGMLIISVIEGMPAEDAGLIPAIITYNDDGSINQIDAQDIILAIDNHTIIDDIDWQVYVAEHVSPGQDVILTILRSGEIIYIEVTPTVREQYQE